MAWLNRLGVWLANHGHLLLAAVLAFLLGMATMLPLGVVLPDSSASMIGALVGSIITISGALILWKAQEVQRTTHLARSIAMQFGNSLFACSEVLEKTTELKQIVDDADRHLEAEAVIEGLRWCATALLREIDATKTKMQRFNQALYLLTSEQIGELMLVEASLDTIYANAEIIALLTRQENPIGILVPGKLQKAHDDLARFYEELGESLESFAPRWSDT